jgi:hypothetical protein
MSNQHTAWAIVPINWEYDDEYHYEEGFEEPSKVFLDEAKAREEADLLNAREFKGRGLGDYGGPKGPELAASVESSAAAIRKIIEIVGHNRLQGDGWRPNAEIDPDDDQAMYCLAIPEDITDEQALEISKLFALSFYTVTPVPLES